MQHRFDDIKTLVVKIGTTLLSHEGGFNVAILKPLVQDLLQLKAQKKLNLILVSSGAIGCGMDALGLKERPVLLPQKQATAAIGQARLIHIYETLFNELAPEFTPAQILLSSRDLSDRQSYLNVRNTLNALFEMNSIIPIVNENDSIATQELKFGDNDTLSARVASKIGADLLIILSDVSGLYTGNPQTDPNVSLIPYVEDLSEEIVGFAKDTRVASSIGGMKTKLDAAKISVSSGLPMVIANGHASGVISGVLSGSVECTLFGVKEGGMKSRKRWIAFGLNPKGSIQVDEGARRALCDLHKSLLPAGVVNFEGPFESGDAVQLLGPEGEEFGRGLVNYSSQDLMKIQGCQTTEIIGKLGSRDYESVVHRDNLAIL